MVSQGSLHQGPDNYAFVKHKGKILQKSGFRMKQYIDSCILDQPDYIDLSIVKISCSWDLEDSSRPVARSLKPCSSKLKSLGLLNSLKSELVLCKR